MEGWRENQKEGGERKREEHPVSQFTSQSEPLVIC